MDYAADSELAMILPLPTPPRSAEDALHWIDLSGYPTFFDDLHRCIEWPRSASPLTLSAPLAIHEVGSFEASFVPHQDDFARLDPRFSIAKSIWAQIPAYDDYGFAVFKLKAGARHVHPMAFAFPRRDPDTLFFPTVHIHHNEVEAAADFDHELYYQATSQTKLLLDDRALWAIYEFPLRDLERYVDIPRTQGLVNDWPGQVLRVAGHLPNRDIILRLQP